MTKVHKNYIWHCPSKECRKKGIVILKTETLIIGNGSVKCPVCGIIHSFKKIEKANIQNFEKKCREVQE